MNAIVMKYAGPLMKFPTSHTPRSTSNSPPASGMRYDPSERLRRASASVWAWVATADRFERRGRREDLPRRQRSCVVALLREAVRRDDRLDRVELAVGLPVDRD